MFQGTQLNALLTVLFPCANFSFKARQTGYRVKLSHQNQIVNKRLCCCVRHLHDSLRDSLGDNNLDGEYCIVYSDSEGWTYMISSYAACDKPTS